MVRPSGTFCSRTTRDSHHWKRAEYGRKPTSQCVLRKTPSVSGRRRRLPGEPGMTTHFAANEEHGFLTISNLLSLARIPLGLTFLALDDPMLVAAVVAAGAVTDLLDGAVARLTGTQTEVGALLDPFCDRIFVFLALVSFLPTGYVDWAGFLILILRDMFTGGVFMISKLAGGQAPFHSRMGGRITTSLQVVALFTL
ncbi:MAG: CDP-alcohol phosphatidyltransferase family protein, partial [Gemmatimonadales bacterium]